MATDSSDPEPDRRTGPPASRTLGAPGHAVRRVVGAAAERPLLWSIVLAAAATAVFFTLLTPTFENNDDVGMMFIADGTFYGTPRPHVIFQNPAVGVVLAALYRWTTAINWYSMWLYSLHVAALTAILYSFLSDRRTGIGVRLGALGGIGLAFTMWMWMNLQFTSAAITVGAAGVLLYLAVGARADVRYHLLAGAGILVGLSSLARWRSFQAVALLALPLVVAAVRRIPWRRQAVFAGSAAAVVLVGMTFSALFYAGDDEWHDYFAFNEARGAIHGTARAGLAGLPEVREAAGWSGPDVRMFRSWFFIDDTIYTIESLENITAATGTPTNDLWPGLRDLADGDGMLRLIVLAAALTAGAALAGSRGRLLLAGTTVWFAIVAGGLVVFSRFPDRVAVPIFGFLALVGALQPEAVVGEPPQGTPVPRRIAATAGVVAVIVALVPAWNLVRRSGDNDAANANFFAMTETLTEIDPDGTFVSWGNALAPQRVSATATDRVAATIVPLGWHQRSPMHQQRLADLGITDLYEAIAVDEHVGVPLRLGAPEAGHFAAFYRVHYGFRGMLRPVQRFDAGGRLVSYDVLVDYRLTDTSVIERRADGSTIVLPFDRAAGTGEVTIGADGGITGWAAALDPPGRVDLLVAFDEDGDRVLALTIPVNALDDVATRFGLARGTALGFTLHVGEEAVGRVVAVVAGRAVELDRTG